MKKKIIKQIVAILEKYDVITLVSIRDVITKINS